MILLPALSQSLVEAVRTRFLEKPETVDIMIADFDGVIYHLSTPETKTKLVVSIRMRCFQELKRYGVEEFLKRLYGNYLTKAEQGYDFSLLIDIENIPEQNRNELCELVGLLKRNIMASVFEVCFDEQESGKLGDLKAIHYREDEAIYLKAQEDRVTIIFSTTFKDETDVIFGKVFLQEFVDARKQPNLQNAPPVLYTSKEPPLELRNDRSIKIADNVGYITFVLFPRHYSKEKRQATISLIQTFRDYLHYHIKCSKAYMHTSMRAKVSEFLKVLNRAKPDVTGEKKTVSGRTFKRT